MAVVQTPQEHRVVLHNISWTTYERLLGEHSDTSVPRFSYDRGELEIMSPLPEHERYSRLLDLLVTVVAAERGVEVYGLGSTTFRREDLQRGFEADSSFYVQHVGAVRGRDRIDLSQLPPPDLVIEVEITSPVLSKLDILAAIGVPEVWRYDGRALSILVLREDGYADAEESRALPGVRSDQVSRLVEQCKGLGNAQWLRLLQDWARGLAR